MVKQVTAEIKYATFQSTSHQMILESPISDKAQLYDKAVKLFDNLWDGSPIRLLGIRTGKLQKVGEPYQLNLFDYQKQLEHQNKERAEKEKQKKDRERKKQMEDAIKTIEKKYGSGVITKGFK